MAIILPEKEFENKEDRWSERFFGWASQAINPHCSLWRYNYYRLRLPFDKFDCYESRVKEVAFRALIVAVDVGLVAAAIHFPVVAISSLFGLPILFLVFRATASLLQQKGPGLGGFSHTRGSFPEKSFEEKRVRQMTLNVAALAGGLSYGFAGVNPWEQRIDKIVEMIKAERPDVLVLQEVMDTDFSNALIKKLHGEFSHFFAHLGVSRGFPFSGGFAPGGMMIATKGAVAHFSDHPFKSNTNEQCRSFGCLELLDCPGGRPFARFLGTHLAWKEEDAGRRALQWQQMRDYIEAKRDPLPTFILADTNTERDEEEGQALLSWLDYSYLGENPTCYHILPSQWKPDGRFHGDDPASPRQIDNIAVVRQGTPPLLEECRLVKTFIDDPHEVGAFDTRSAISDHHAIVLDARIIVI